MGLLDGILKFVQKIVEAVLSEITKQVNRVQNEVLNEMMKMVTSGFDDVWRGEDANAFKEKVQKIASPKATDIISFVTKVGNGLKQAGDIIQGADKKATQIVGDIASEFSKI
jgi:uncharacterized protein YukE